MGKNLARKLKNISFNKSNIFTIIINQKMRRSEIEKMIFAFPATTWGIFNFFLNNVLID